MEPLPSRSSSDTKSLRGSTASAASDTSSASSFSTISSQLDTLNAMTLRERAEVDANMQRLLPVLETLLSQFDIVNSATEEVYLIEQSLEKVQTRAVKKRRQHTSVQKMLFNAEVTTGLNRSFTTTQCRSSKSEPYQRVGKYSHAPRPATVSQVPESTLASKVLTVDKVVAAEEPALIPMQISYSSQNKRRKAARAHNRVHPSVT